MVSQKIDDEELRRLIQDEAMLLPDMGIVVSGISGRFPKSESINEYEQNLSDGVDMIADQDSSRFECGLFGLPPRAGRLKDLTKFDCEFFGYKSEEANYIDFQMRLLYEVVYESILDAGVNPTALRGTNTGVFFGLHCTEFENALADDPNFKSNGYYAQYAVKVAQYFDLRGKTATFDAACASSFVGLHSAVQALADGVIDQAIVCSSNIPIHPTGSLIFLQMQMLSPTGYSRFMDSRADGYVKSEACVSFLIQRKHLALRNYASIMATMTSVDGYKSEGITFPSAESQEYLIRSTKQLAGISTNHIEYLEAHGTGTPAGDPQEARAISNVYYPLDDDTEEADKEQQLIRVEDPRKIGPLLVGSVKTNMGHSEAASGLCALAKVVLMLEKEIIYKGLHYEQPNSNIDSLMDGRLKFVEENMELRGKIVPLSCYGFGGANVHVIVRANDKPAIDFGEQFYQDSQTPRLIVMFGRTKAALNAFFDHLLSSDSRSTRFCLSDDFLALVDQLNTGPIDRLMEYRGYVVLNREEGGNKQLARAIKRCQLTPVCNTTLQPVDLGRPAHVQDCAQRPCNLVYPGLGCQWTGMAHGLTGYMRFWSTIERLATMLEPFRSDIDLIRLMAGLDTDYENAQLKTMTGIFVAIVAYQIALTNLVKDQLKLKNLASIVGHSLGEISCAYAAGLFSEREAILVAYRMGKTLDANRHLIAGKMVAVGMGEQEAAEKISDGYQTIRVSCVNGPKSVTLSGSNDEMDAFCSQLKQADGIFMKELDCPIALHNESIMGPNIRESLKEALLMVLFPLAEYRIDKSSWISSISTEATNANADYFAASLCKKVDFVDALSHLADDSIALELGPSGLFESQLLQLDSSVRVNQSKFHYAKLMNRSTPAEQQALILTKSIGELYQAGAILNLTHFYHGNNMEFPVRRQTPSLSSIFQWDHQHSMFVPRYPSHFSKSSAKCEMPVDLVNDRDKYIIDHCIEGRVLYPATGYLFVMWRVFSFTKRKIYDACFHEIEHELVPIEFHNVRLMRAVILGSRAAQLYIHYEEGTGRFEIKEGGSVVAEGFACLPGENPDGLLYDSVRQQIQGENLDLVLNSNDIYKQFRVSGYDYGEKFQNIEAASIDGRYCHVKYNGYFASLTDSILQSIFLAISQYAPSGGLFLPTRFDYVRFQPAVILNKIRQAKWPFDLGDKALNTEARRELMGKIMQRTQAGGPTDETAPDTAGDRSSSAAKKEEEKPLECIFETFCDPITGIIITDGIEMRGIKATPAPRRSEAGNSEILLESYQFVCDEELPVDDENLTQFEHTIKPYANVCDSMSLELLANLSGKPALNINQLIKGCDSLPTKESVEAYKVKHLSSIYKTRQSKSERHDSEDHHYDIKKNGDRMLLSVLDQLCGCGDTDPKAVREVVQKNRQLLMRDLIQSPLTGERFMRPLVEMVIENCCTKKAKLRMLEVNLDDGLIKEPLQHIIQSVAPMTTLDYALAHPEPSRISNHKALSGQQTRTYQLKDLQSLFAEHQLSGLDFIAYKDISCYSLPKQVIEQNGLSTVLSTLNGAVIPGGFIMVIMRQRLSLAERILLALCEPKLVGLSKKDLDHLGASGDGSNGNGKLIEGASLVAADKINHINNILETRCKQMISEAERNKMICLAKKRDSNGCTVLLFKASNTRSTSVSGDASKSMNESALSPIVSDDSKRILLRVVHDDQQSVDKWLTRLKEIFKPAAPATAEKQSETETGNNAVAENSDSDAESIVWLCAVATKENPISGLVGMMQALSKELGWARLRCYYDCYSFKNKQEPVGIEDIERCSRFQEALVRDLCWNCVDSRGNFGSFRHFTINDYMSYENCLCNNSLPGAEISTVCAFVNNAKRGDLSSFTWYESPFKYLSEREQNDLMNVSYAALNFRDVMLATGRLPPDAISIRLAMTDCLLGLEYAGYDSRGQRFMGMVIGRGLATRVLSPDDGAIKLPVPDGMSLREAATIPVVYATAILALVYRGRMKRGESLLVHAGSGGVGQAAIRLAGHHGVEVYATVGSAEKRQFLLDQFPDIMRDDHIFSSRDCDFETQILLATRGRGVDMVLNSLADDMLQASVRCLADGGRFLEIGKYDMSVDARLELLQLDRNKTFHGILLDKMFETDDIKPAYKAQLKGMLAMMKDGLERGYVRPIESTVFKRHQIEEAFRYMATGKHMGKVLIEIEPEADKHSERHVDLDRSLVRTPAPQLACVPRCQFSPQKTYIVTGGLGGFGLELIKWLANLGARHLLLTTRTGIRTGYQRLTIDRLVGNGTKVDVISSEQADACTSEGAQRLCQLAVEMSPIGQVGAIFHLAMVLKDTLLENMSAEDFERVCRPKVSACVELDRVSGQLGSKLDYFVCFSSVTSGKGNAGQSNYAYANSCLERVCEQRRARGEHGLAIQWGAIGDVGVAYENLGGNNVIVGGTMPQRMPSCLSTLAKLLVSPFSVCLSVVPVNRGGSEGAGAKGDLVATIMHVLGIKDASKVGEQATLGELGLDSLMAVEIRQYIEREYEMTLNIQEIRSLTIAKIRDISENGKPAATSSESSSAGGGSGDAPAAATTGNVNNAPVSVDGYGTRGAAQAEGAAASKFTLPASPLKAINDAALPTLDTSVALFKPELTLPKSDYVRLNFKHSDVRNAGASNSKQALNAKCPGSTSGAATQPSRKRPIFFIPPIHGQFDLLEQVCAHIDRPCIGLYWNHKLSRVQTVAEAVEVYLDLLRRANWSREFELPGEDREEEEPHRHVDLVGYSFGATIAFEMMLTMHKLEQRASRRLVNGLSDNQTGGLRAGRLILLDGSPKQIELGSSYMDTLSRRTNMSLADKCDELLMWYIVAHTRDLPTNVDYVDLQRQLTKSGVENKFWVASERLASILGVATPQTNGSIKTNERELDEDDEDDELVEDRRREIACAMEAFCRRYDLITKYKAATVRLPGDCTLIRADKMYLKNADHSSDDLGLSSVVKGKVRLHVMSGDHESFLDNNQREIGEIIANSSNVSRRQSEV